MSFVLPNLKSARAILCLSGGGFCLRIQGVSALTIAIRTLIDELDRLPEYQLYGRVASVLGMLIEVAGLERVL